MTKAITRRGFLSAMGLGVVALAGCSASGASEECEQVANMGLPNQRESTTVTADANQYIRIDVDNNFGHRTHVLVHTPDGEVALSEGVEDSDAWTFSHPDDDVMTTEYAGEWIVEYTPSTYESKTSGDVVVTVCTPAEETQT